MILERASKVTGYSVADITGPSRVRPLAWTRFAIMEALRNQGEKVEYIAALLNRHHTTVVDGLQQAKALHGQPGFEIIRSAIA